MDKHTPIQLPLAIEGATVEIPLTRGFVAVVDAVDADLLELKWQVSPCKNNNFYARSRSSTIDNRRTLHMHRMIVARMIGRNLTRNEMVDHIDGNTLNNRRANLRVATFAENQWNRRKSSANTSGYKGVWWSTKHKKWVSSIRANKKRHCLGEFDTPEAAHEAYCAAAKRLHGEFAKPQ